MATTIEKTEYGSVIDKAFFDQKKHLPPTAYMERLIGRAIESEILTGKEVYNFLTVVKVRRISPQRAILMLERMVISKQEYLINKGYWKNKNRAAEEFTDADSIIKIKKKHA